MEKKWEKLKKSTFTKIEQFTVICRGQSESGLKILQISETVFKNQNENEKLYLWYNLWWDFHIINDVCEDLMIFGGDE